MLSYLHIRAQERTVGDRMIVFVAKVMFVLSINGLGTIGISTRAHAMQEANYYIYTVE